MDQLEKAEELAEAIMKEMANLLQERIKDLDDDLAEAIYANVATNFEDYLR
jgi:predicted HTH domain antitoxin